MATIIELEEKKVKKALFQFIFPFSIKKGTENELIRQIKADGYTPFFLDNLDLEQAYYGEEHRVSHQQMERYYLPFTGQILFPHHDNPEAFRRYSKTHNLDCILESTFFTTNFRVLSTDIIVCPFELGFITLRTEIDEELDFSQAVEFADRFRVLEDVTEKDDFTNVRCSEKVFNEVEAFIFQHLMSGILPFLDKTGMAGAYFETLPFFVDERMFVQAFYQFTDPDGSITQLDNFRAVQLDGIDVRGRAYISANSLPYIEDYCVKHEYGRWSPDTVYLMNEHTFCCLTNSGRNRSAALANQMYGEYYYGLLLNLFHKIVLLKLSNRYSNVRMGKDNDEVENLIRSITKFSAKYYFLELVSQSQGREIFVQMRRVFGNNELFMEVKETLTNLYEYQDRVEKQSQNYLLMILTLYTVIGGIYGMNQVIEDLKGKIDWSKMLEYSVFEYIALFITFTGIIVGFALAFIVIYRWLKRWLKNRKEPDAA
jgi:succinate dehydrogenase hydrophobic anchor subunit